MMAIGFIWAAFAPLSLVACFSLIYFLTKPIALSKRVRIVVSLAATLLPVLLLWIPARLEFGRVCEVQGKPVILKNVQADGFFLDDSTANSFGMRYLQAEGFLWIEAKSIYHPGKFTRYEINGDKISESEVDKISAKYVLKSQHHQRDSYSDTELVITEIQTGEKLASAHSMIFDGGMVKWVLGGWGVVSCPSALTEAEDFTTMYHLAKLTMRPESGK